jgi:hypothetical protein
MKNDTDKWLFKEVKKKAVKNPFPVQVKTNQGGAPGQLPAAASCKSLININS